MSVRNITLGTLYDSLFCFGVVQQEDSVALTRLWVVSNYES